MFGNLLAIIACVACGQSSANAAEQPKSAAIRLTGRVVTEAGQPVAGAAVYLWYRAVPDKHYKGHTLQRTATSKAGWFELRDLPQCRAIMVVRHKEFAIGMRHVIVTEEQAAEQLELILEPPRKLTIHVADPDGRPLAKARVQELHIAGPEPLHHALAQRIGLPWPESDQFGRIVLDAIPRSATVTGVVAHPDYVSVEIPKQTPSEASDPVSIRLAAGTPVTLRVVGRDVNVPRQGLLLDLYLEGETLLADEPITLDENGEWRTILAPGRYAIRLLHPDFQALPNLQTGLEVGRDEPARLQFGMTARGTVTGRVIQTSSGRPLAGRMINAFVHSPDHPENAYGVGPGWSYSARGMTDSQGRYTLDPGTGNVRLFLTQETEYVSEDPYVDVALTSADHPVAAREIRLRDLPKLTGVVVDADGKPIARPVLQPIGDQAYRRPHVGGDDGRFTFQVEEISRDSDTDWTGFIELLVFDPFGPGEQQIKVPLDPWRGPERLRIVLKPTPISALPALAEKPTGDSLIGNPAPEWEYAATFNTERERLRLENYRGQWVLLDFWGFWCAPCLYAMPIVENTAELYRDRLVVIGIHDNSLPAEGVRQRLAENGPSIPVILDSKNGTTAERYGIESYPTYVLIDPEGRVAMTSLHNRALRGQLIPTLRRVLYGRSDAKP